MSCSVSLRGLIWKGHYKCVSLAHTEQESHMQQQKKVRLHTQNRRVPADTHPLTFRKTMDTRKWITIVAALLVVGVACPAEACRCIKNHLQRFYCSSNAVLKMRFIEPTQITDNGSQVKGYKIQVDEVVKGDAALQSLTFISSSAGTSCEYYHNESDYNVEYLVTAYNNNGDIAVNGCHYVVPWSELSPKQILGIQGAYNEGCTCDITSCFSPPCSPAQKTCAIAGDGNPQAENQQKNQACVPNSSTTCIWKTIQ